MKAFLDTLEVMPDNLAARWLLNVAAMTVGEYPQAVPDQFVIPAEAFRSDEPFPRFVNVAPRLRLNTFDLAGGAVVEDLDGDGLFDIVVSTMDPTGPMHAFRNVGNGTFEERTARAGLTGLLGGLNMIQADYDNDGWLDFYLGTGFPHYEGIIPNVMYHNREGQRFSDVTTAGGFGNLQKGHGVAFADLDCDGDQDVFEQMGGAYPGDAFGNTLYENPGFGNHWLQVHLVGTRSNRSAIGARLRAVFTEGGKSRSLTRWVDSGGSFGANPLCQHLGLGEASRVDLLEVYWPTTGVTQSFRDLSADRRVRVTEGEAGVVTVPVPKFSLH